MIHQIYQPDDLSRVIGLLLCKAAFIIKGTLLALKKQKAQGQRTAFGFDFGTKSIGIAIGQEVTGNATPIGAVKATDGIPNWEHIDKYIEEWQPCLLIVGLPLNMDGTFQEVTYGARKFSRRLENRYKIATYTQDERLSTTDARAQLFDKGGYKNLTKEGVDSVSASLILQSWFENNPPLQEESSDD